MRRPTPPVPRWTPCPDEARGLVCPQPMANAITVVINTCTACERKPPIGIHALVIEISARTLHWTCPCGQPNTTKYDEYVEQGHYMCALARSGADVLRDDTIARAAAAILEAKIRKVTS